MNSSRRLTLLKNVSTIMAFALCLMLAGCGSDNEEPELPVAAGEETDVAKEPAPPAESTQTPPSVTEPGPPATPAPTPTPVPMPPKEDYAETAEGISVEMVWIPGGAFQMGSPASEEGRGLDEGPLGDVALDGFWLAKYEATQQQYEAIMGEAPSHFKGPDRPVESVTWTEAAAFCEALSSLTGRPYTLPTEAQWEYACRAGSQSRFCSGDSESGIDDYAWHESNAGEETHPVGAKKANNFGLHDMHGNVWEWCADWYDMYSKDSQSAQSGEDRVLRGSSWSYDPIFCRSANRGKHAPDDSTYHFGFRVALNQR